MSENAPRIVYFDFRVIRMEKSDLETERVRLVEDVLENKATMKELEDNLLEKLTSVEGSLVEDEGTY